MSRRTLIRKCRASSDRINLSAASAAVSNALPALSNRLRNLDLSAANRPFKIVTDMPLPLSGSGRGPRHPRRVLFSRSDAGGEKQLDALPSDRRAVTRDTSVSTHPELIGPQVKMMRGKLERRNLWNSRTRCGPERATVRVRRGGGDEGTTCVNT